MQQGKPSRWTLLLAVGLLALVVRLVYISQISHAPFFDLRLGDAEAYHHWALRIADGDWLGEGVFYQAPLYPYFLAGVYAVFGEGVAMVRFIQAAIGAGSCMLLAAAGMALFGTWGVLAGVLLALYAPAIFFDGLLEKSALVTFFTCGLLYLLSARHVRFREFLAGVALGLLGLTRENALLLGIPVLLWFLVGKRPVSWRPSAAFLAGCVLVLLPVGLRNYTIGGEFHLTTSQLGPNFYIGNHAGARGLYDPLVPGRGNVSAEREDATRLAEAAAGRRLTPDEVSSYWTAQALAFIRTQPGAWVRLLARKLALTFNAVEIADTESQEVYAEWSPLLRMLAPISFGVILCLSAFGAGMTLHAWRRVWFLHAIALTYTVSIFAFYVFARYRFPLVPVLIVFAAGGLAFWRAESAKPMRRWAFAALVLAGGIAYLPLESTRLDRTAHYLNIANALLLRTKLDQAQLFYGKALEESPRLAAAHFGMGMVLASKNRLQDAIVHYRAAVDGSPDNPDVRLNLALALSGIGDSERALDELEVAARLRPADPMSYLIAGNVLRTLNRPEEAVEKYRLALNADPQNADARRNLQMTQAQLGEKP